MNHYKAIILWKRDNETFTDIKYSRKHRWQFDGGLEIPASTSPQEVAIPQSDPSAVDPEEAFVASISSCHMLWFLSIAASQGFLVDDYKDEAVGLMEKNVEGNKAITQVILHPTVIFDPNMAPNQQKFDKLHEQAHNMCFIAHSVSSKITVKATLTSNSL